ncbi:acyl transferase/acyl hydrolase/lysophospholipase [Flammula alnicola]|nr:acyl transferase/acyl hydrolase/lysophospholipase [Flammula alnicola]
MLRVQSRKGLAELPKPCDYFHLIGGTSTGGLISIMLGRLQMTTEQAMEKYNIIAKNIFSKKNRKRKAQDGSFKSTTLKEEIQKVVAGTFEGYTGEELMFDHSVANEMGKAFVCAVSADNMRFITRFRTYRVNKNQSSNCKIWEAARATTATATFFKRIDIPGVGGILKPFLDAGIKCNNPVMEVREEARLIFGDVRKVGLLVSLGTGQSGTIGLKKPDAFQKLLPTKLIDTLKNIATDCEAVADALTTQFITHAGLYFRFNVTHGAGEVSLEEWEMSGTIVAHTESYLRDARVSADVDSVDSSSVQALPAIE